MQQGWRRPRGHLYNLIWPSERPVVDHAVEHGECGGRAVLWDHVAAALDSEEGEVLLVACNVAGQLLVQ